jgi:hypothetical protein
MALADVVQKVVKAVEDAHPVEDISSWPNPLWSSLDVHCNLCLGTILERLDKTSDRKWL